MVGRITYGLPRRNLSINEQLFLERIHDASVAALGVRCQRSTAEIHSENTALDIIDLATNRLNTKLIPSYKTFPDRLILEKVAAPTECQAATPLKGARELLEDLQLLPSSLWRFGVPHGGQPRHLALSPFQGLFRRLRWHSISFEVL